MQTPLFTPETEWVMPEELKDLTGAKQIAIDLETNDPGLKELGSGNVTGKGHIAGVAVAVEGWSGYFPIGHESNGNMDKKLVFSWLQDITNAALETFSHDPDELHRLFYTGATRAKRELHVLDPKDFDRAYIL